MTSPNMTAWLIGGLETSRRTLGFEPYGEGEVKCTIRVVNGTREMSATGAGLDISTAFADAYTELTKWLL